MSVAPLADPLGDVVDRHAVTVGNVTMGGGAPVVVQSMTNTDTAEVDKTVEQVVALADEGSELVRLTVNNDLAAAAVPKIKEQLLSRNIDVPLVGDFHFNGHKLLNDYPACAEALDKYRINPGNVGRGAKKDTQFATMIEIACRYDKPVRIGVNWGSLDQALLAQMLDDNAKLASPVSLQRVMQDAVIQSALDSAKLAESVGLSANKIVLSCKTSQVQDLISIYRRIAVSYTHLTLPTSPKV